MSKRVLSPDNGDVIPQYISSSLISELTYETDAYLICLKGLEKSLDKIFDFNLEKKPKVNSGIGGLQLGAVLGGLTVRLFVFFRKLPRLLNCPEHGKLSIVIAKLAT